MARANDQLQTARRKPHAASRTPHPTFHTLQAVHQGRFFFWLLAALFVVVFSIRLTLTLQAENFSGEEAYFTMRQVESIMSTGLPLYHDQLSFGGRDYIFAPLFYYLAALLALASSPWFVGKVVMNLAAASMLLLIYGVTKKITHHEQSAVFSAFVGSFIPVFFVTTLNTFSITAVVFPMLFLLVYLFLDIEKPAAAPVFMAVFFILAFTHYISVLFIISWLIYLILLKVNDAAASRAEIEIGIFSIFLFLWTQLLIYKDALLQHGVGIVWQNVPHHIFEAYFKSISLTSALYLIGLIPLLYGIYAVFYHTFYAEKNKKTAFLVAFTIATSILLWLGFIKIELGLVSLGAIMSILFSEFYLHIFEYLRKTRFAHYQTIIALALFAVVISSSVAPSLAYAKRSVRDAVSADELEAYTWLRGNTPKDAVVLSSPQEGHLVASIAGRKNVLDTNFLLIAGSDKIFEDVAEIYSTEYETEAIKLLNAHDVDYIAVGRRAKRQFGSQNLGFLSDERCFRNVFSNAAVKIYESKCQFNG